MEVNKTYSVNFQWRRQKSIFFLGYKNWKYTFRKRQIVIISLINWTHNSSILLIHNNFKLASSNLKNYTFFYKNIYALKMVCWNAEKVHTVREILFSHAGRTFWMKWKSYVWVLTSIFRVASLKFHVGW